MNNNNGYLSRGSQINPGGAIDPDIGINLLQQLDAALPSVQIASAIAKFSRKILPYYASITNTFSAVSVSVDLSLQIDSTYYFLIYGISCVRQSTDRDNTITSINVSSLTNLLQNPLPLGQITQFTAKPMDFFMVVPANNTFTTTVLNGATTAANRIDITYHGLRVPTQIAENLLSIGLIEGIV